MYDKSSAHYKYWMEAQMGNPDENKELWEERSPINYAQNLEAKLLVIHGKNDPRCPIEQAKLFKDKLLLHGKKEGKDGDFEYIELQDEGHGTFSDPTGRYRTIELLLNFLERHLQ